MLVADTRGLLFSASSMIVGTETSATALSALTYLLLKSPDKLERLVREVRSVGDSNQLKGDVLKDLPYLQACLTECLRCTKSFQSLVSMKHN